MTAIGGKNRPENHILQVDQLTVCYGAMYAIRDVSLCVNEGEIVAIVGPNGAGKSTLLKAISRVLEGFGGRIAGGDVLLKGKSVDNLRTDQLVSLGLAFMPAGRHIFSTMSVLENLEMGGYARTDKAMLKGDMEEVLNLFPRLRERTSQRAGTLSTGEQQMLAIGRALISKPQILLADEPSMGLSPNFVDLIFDKLIEINRKGTAILLVEQNALMALDICDRGYVFKIGSIALQGTRDELLASEQLREAFLGSTQSNGGK